MSREVPKFDIDKIEKLANKATKTWLKPTRDFDYVSFGPGWQIKDNNEGNKADYALAAEMSPKTVLEMCAEIRRLRGDR